MPITYNPRRTAWNVTWNAAGVGTVYEVQPDLSYELEPIKRASTGKIVLGEWIVNLKGMVKVQLADVQLALEQAMAPWWSVGSIPLMPTSAPPVNIYQYAQELILHPVDQGATTTEDLHLTKTVPMKPVSMKRQGEKDDLWEMEFRIFPDVGRLQAATPFLTFGYVGNVAI